MLSIVYVCLCFRSCMCTFALSYMCTFAFIVSSIGAIFLLPLLSSQWNSYSAICGHTGRSSSVRRNQLFLSMWWKISEIKCALLRECMRFQLMIQSILIARRHCKGTFLVLSYLFPLLSDFKVNTRNQYLLPSEKYSFAISLSVIVVRLTISKDLVRSKEILYSLLCYLDLKSYWKTKFYQSRWVCTEIALPI